MRYILLMFCLFPLNACAQYYCVSFFNSAIDRFDSPYGYELSLTEDVAFFSHTSSWGDGHFDIHTLYSCDYHISNDTLILRNCNNYLSYDTLSYYYFKIIEDGILESLSKLSFLWEKGDVFYCSWYEYEYYESLSGSEESWKDGKKNGVWRYRDSLWNVYDVIYEDNVVKEKILIKESWKPKKEDE